MINYNFLGKMVFCVVKFFPHRKPFFPGMGKYKMATVHEITAL